MGGAPGRSGAAVRGPVNASLWDYRKKHVHGFTAPYVPDSFPPHLVAHVCIGLLRAFYGGPFRTAWAVLWLALASWWQMQRFRAEHWYWHARGLSEAQIEARMVGGPVEEVERG